MTDMGRRDRAAYAAAVLEIADTQPAYRIGGDGSDGTCDCVGLGIGALRRMDIQYDGLHGSNWAARHEAVELWEIQSVKQLRVGDNVLKARAPGDKGWALPTRYNDDPDQNDYYHMGVVLSVEPLRIVHCTEPTCRVDTKLSRWSHAFVWRQLSNAIDVPKQEKPAQGELVEEEMTMEALYEAQVVLSESKALNIRAGRSTAARKIGSVPNGATVIVCQEGAWPLIEYDGLQGYVSGEYLKAIEPAPEPVRKTALINEEGTVIVLEGSWRVAED